MYMDWVAAVQFLKAAVSGVNKVTTKHSMTENMFERLHVHPVACCSWN